MSTMSTTGLYAEDLYGTNPANHITNEIQTLQVPGADDYYFIIPLAAPFFADSMQVYNAQTSAKYTENVDYELGHYFIDAMDSIGRPICGSIRFLKRSIVGQVRLQYRTIGGVWGFSDTEILAELSNKRLNPLVRTWGQIAPIPYAFPPLSHDQPLNSLVGSEEIRDAIERLTAVIEETHGGSSDTHATNYNNPHKVTAAQVGLPLVPNFAMATDTQAIAGLRSDLFLSPLGAKLLITEIAIKPLQAHINAKGNVHGMTAADINLGNVPNYPAATPTTAVDVTNDRVLLTPYTASLLFQRLSNSQLVQELSDKLNAHILDENNPHKVTPSKIGTYTALQIDQKIAAGGGGGSGGDAATFGGKTPSEWEDGFVGVQNAEDLLTKVTDQTEANTAVVLAVLVEDPVDQAQVEALRKQLIAATYAGYNTYSVINGNNTAAFVEATGQDNFPEQLKQSVDSWFARKDAYYYIAANGSVHASGSAAIQAPAGYRDDASFLVANRISRIWASKDTVFIQRWTANTQAPGELLAYTSSTGAPTVVKPAADGTAMVLTNSQLVQTEENILIEAPTNSFKAYGTGDWVTKSNAAVANALQRLKTVDPTDVINSVALSDNYLIFMGSTTGTLLVYDIVRAAGVYTITYNAAPVWRNANGVVPTAQVTNAQMVTGRYGHVIAITADGRVFGIGDNSNGQLDVDPVYGTFLSATAGNGFTTSVTANNRVQFWGDSPDNSLLYINKPKYVMETP